MTETSAATLKRTPLYDIHVALGGKIVPFAGYEMPVQYTGGITAEHKAVRESCGIFDVSHMGEFWITGDRAVDFVNYVTTNDVAALAVGQVHYSTILNDRGTIEDDCLVYRFEDRIMMVVNASNAQKDFSHIHQHVARFGDVQLMDASDDVALLAVQGPDAAKILQALTPVELSEIEYYHFTEGAVANHDAIISRTGYTGEDGFELYVTNDSAVPLWNALVKRGVVPAGLGARDTLRLEMGMALYGNDIDDTTTPLEANLGWLVKLDKGDFVGRDALVAQKERGLERKLVGFTMAERNFPRHGYPVFYDGQPSGVVCSGTMSPTLGIPIGTCYLPLAGTKPGSSFEIEIRGKRVPATVTKPPFYKHASHL